MVRDERGHGVLDVFLLGLLFLAPLIWGLGVLADLHRAALATTAAVREAGFDAAKAGDRVEAGRAVDLAVTRALVDHSLDPTSARVRWDATSELGRGGEVEVEMTYRVPVLQAPFLGRVSGPSILVTARHVAPIDPYRSR
jgi:hypothetical protein